ncbi:MAG TPA: efflux RND transporter periplasmic adaptor subunit [Kofleriaceae bacterium]|nr:efflux RND transporter periplasmic adaptor subunit [Kofleriaceae bacterium]
MRGLVFVLAVAAAAGCKKPSDSGAGSAKPPPAPPVKIATVVANEGPTPDVIVVTGLVAADQRSDVTADTQGKVINVLCDRGQRVKIGQPCVQLDVRSAALGAREAAANLAAARSQKQLADQECERTKSLLEKGAITKSEYDRQMAQCTSAQEQDAAVQARNEMMSKSVADGMVRAPFDGIVSEKMVSPGEWVAPGKPLFSLVDDDPLKVELSVSEIGVNLIKKDERVEVVATAQPDKKYGATITRLGAEIGRTRSLIVEATLDKGADLVPGMFTEAHIQVGQTNRVILPADAVIKRGKTWHAFVVKNGELEERLVQLGATPGENQVSIVQGVAKGEKVATKLDAKIVDGLKVVE